MQNLNSANEMYECFKLFGKFFITVDNQLDEKVLNDYSECIGFLKDKYGNITEKPIKLNIPTEEKETEEEEESLEDYLAELNKLIGLENVKKDVNQMMVEIS
jgi:hypothetical protein